MNLTLLRVYEEFGNRSRKFLELLLKGGAELWHLANFQVELHPFMRGSFMLWLAAKNGDWT